MTAADAAPTVPVPVSRPHIPLWVKLAYTFFMTILVPVYLIAYGPTNFLYFCDVAVLMTLPALWLESALLASAPLVGILVPQLLWQADFLARLAGLPLTGTNGLTGYMFKDDPHWFSLLTRGLSFFHFWLPLFLLWVVYRLGYDRRAFWLWTALIWVLLPVCYFLMPGPHPNADPNLPININYVYGFSNEEPQTWMPPLAYLGALMLVLPFGITLPTHLVLALVFSPPKPHGVKSASGVSLSGFPDVRGGTVHPGGE